MSRLDALRHRLRVWLRPAAYSRELQEEQAFHIALDAMRREHAGRGSLSAEEARSAARRRFGNVTVHREETRAMAGLGFLDVLQQDLRFGLRSFARTPGFTAVAALTLAVGIGANTAIFSAIDALLLRPLPFVEPERLMKISLTHPPRGEFPGSTDAVWSWPKFVVFRDNQRVFTNVSLYGDAQLTVRTAGDVERVRAEVTDAKYFAILGVRPLLGRTFQADEDSVVGGPKVAILSDSYWQRRFNADSSVIGKPLSINAQPYVVIAVLPRGFRGLTGQADIWIPALAEDPIIAREPWGHRFTQIGRLAPGVGAAQAKAAVEQLGRLVDRTYPHPQFAGEQWGAVARELDTVRVDPLVRQSLFILMGAVVLVLLIACANVANLFLVRATARAREIAVRLAVGASRQRIVRQLLTESVLISAVGGALSILVAWGGVRALSSLDPVSALNVRALEGLGAVSFADIHLSVAALAVTASLSIATGVLFGMVPALQSTRPSLSVALKSGRTREQRTHPSLFDSRNVLVAVEIALALVLLAGSGLMVRSLGKLLAVSPGFAPEGLLSMRLNVREGFARDSMPGFYEQVTARLAALPGVTGVTLQDCPPLSGGCNGTSLQRRDRPAVSAELQPEVGIHWIAPNWPTVMRVPLRSGRLFKSGDRAGSRKVVLVSETAARRIWPGEDAIGKPLSVAQGGFDTDTAYVVGVVGDVRYGTIDSLPRPDVYLSHQQSPRGRMMIMLRTAGDAAALAPAVGRIIRQTAPDLPLYDIRTMASRVADATAYARFGALLLVLFGLVALLLAVLGTYGTVAFSVSQRTREIGIRVALGATHRDVVRLIVGQGLAVAIVGAGAGVIVALVSTRALRSLLYDVAPSDPMTFCVMIAVLLAAAATASWMPARRAAGVEPTLALRQE